MPPMKLLLTIFERKPSVSRYFRISFRTMERLEGCKLTNIEDLYAVDSEARRVAADLVRVK